MVGYTLMMAGVTRIIEVSFIAPKYTALTESAPSDDNNSEHTLTDSSSSSASWQSAKAFRHLPPFVSLSALIIVGHLKTYVILAPHSIWVCPLDYYPLPALMRIYYALLQCTFHVCH